MAEIGDVYLPADPKIDNHPRVVISDPEQNAVVVVLVNFTGAEGEFRDLSCVLDVGEHPWLTKRTCISYKDASCATEKELETLVKRGALKKLDPVSDKVLDKIFDGAERTDELPLKYRKILASQGLVNE